MSKKRILSNGYSSYWRDDEPKPAPKVYTEEEQRIRDAFHNYVPDNTYMIYAGKGFIDAFDKALKQELKERYGNSNN